MQASVIYERTILVDDERHENWLLWKITKMSTTDGARIYLAAAHLPSMGGMALSSIEQIGQSGSITAHQTKGLATAIGIWHAMRRPPMLQRAIYFRDLVPTGLSERSLVEQLDSEYHFGLNPRACTWAEQAGLL